MWGRFFTCHAPQTQTDDWHFRRVVRGRLPVALEPMAPPRPRLTAARTPIRLRRHRDRRTIANCGCRRAAPLIHPNRQPKTLAWSVKIPLLATMSACISLFLFHCLQPVLQPLLQLVLKLVLKLVLQLVLQLVLVAAGSSPSILRKKMSVSGLFCPPQFMTARTVSRIRLLAAWIWPLYAPDVVRPWTS